MIVPIPDREYEWFHASYGPSPTSDRNGYVGALTALPEGEPAPSRPIGFRMPERKTVEPGPALPDWLLERS